MKENKIQINFKKILNNAGLKNTLPRLTVLKILSETKHPKTTKDIFNKLKKNDIDLVTLYRTLSSFEEKKIIKRVDLQKDAVYYELNTDHHHHIICTNCDKVADFVDENHEKLITKALAQVKNFKSITSHSFDLFGICNSCSAK
ncbi:MAG: Fur family transcriptional regulator [Patescibacteria group bacterium]